MKTHSSSRIPQLVAPKLTTKADHASSLIFLPPFFCLMFSSPSFHLTAAAVTFESSETQTSLLELYTSEGCSSCPPAEKWLSRLKESPGLWKDFVPVAFHVDYWDYLGWRDRWSSKTFTDRQHAYASAWRSDSDVSSMTITSGGSSTSTQP